MMNNNKLPDIRREYKKHELSKKSVNANPFVQFSLWFEEAGKADIIDYNAISLATADKNGIPSVRTVLLKGFDEEGFTFFTNYNSEKGRDLRENPNAEILLFWRELERQIRVSGSVKITSREESEAYFKSRPYPSRVSAAVSEQSSSVVNRKYLDNKAEKLMEDCPEDVPLPDNWGGFKLIPVKFEFWQGRANRLHDRICYNKTDEGWEIVRLAP